MQKGFRKKIIVFLESALPDASARGRHQGTIHWMPVISQLWMNLNLSYYLVSPW
jgi:hypothetical protein